MALTEPDFIERDADKITAEMIAKYEADTGKTLYPAQAERLLIDLWAYREMLVRVAVQEAAKQNLVAFAREPMIDYLGELVGVYRLAAQPATTTLQFSVDEALAIDVLIPAGTRVSASDSVIFATDTDVVLKAGLLLVNVTATCTEPGTAGNGWQPAQVSQLLDEIDNVNLLVSNLMASSGGSEQEDDDRLRERIRLAPSHSPMPEAVAHTAFMPCRPIPTLSMLLCFPGSRDRRSVSAAQYRSAGRRCSHAGREFLL